MPAQPEVFLRDLERASDDAESALIRALIVYSAINDEEEEEEGDGLLALFLRSSVAGLAAAVIALTERYDPSGATVPDPERDQIIAEAVVAARVALREAVRSDEAMLSGDGDISRAERLANVAASAITTVRSEIQERIAGFFGFTSKTWITRKDQKVRNTHREIDGHTVPIGSRFVTTGYTIRFPGDRTAPVPGWLNCRCVMRWST